MATLSELLFYKEYHANKVERHEDAVKYYEEEITKKVKEIAKEEETK